MLGDWLSFFVLFPTLAIPTCTLSQQVASRQGICLNELDKKFRAIILSKEFAAPDNLLGTLFARQSVITFV